MPNTYVRLNLASSIYPFYSEAAGRTIMVPGSDENFDRYNAANTVPDKGVPAVFYMHNCMPLAGGFQSIGYIQALAGLAGKTDFGTCFPLFGADQETFLFSPSQGMNYIFDGDVGVWTSVSPMAPGTVAANTLVTTAYVQGITYIYYQGIGCFVYDDIGKVLVPTTLTGLTPTAINGICEANGYLIAWTTTTVAWSSSSDPTDFVPSIQTGAGGGTIQDARGPINFCVNLSGGFLIYCEKNIVGASYTANTGFPYIIAEVAGSGGVGNIDSVGYQGNLPFQVAMTSAGLQQVSLNSAIPTMPELSDFLTAQLFEDFDEDTLSFSQVFIGGQLNVKISAISDRFIVLSYGIIAPDYTHAVVFDIALNRYGKLKLPHRGCFSFVNPAPYGLVTYSELLNTPISSLGNTTYADFFTTLQTAVTPKQNLGFIQADGTVQLVDFQVSEAAADGVFIIGKFQFTRGNVLVHQRTDVETVNVGNSFSLSLLPTFDGKDFGPAVATIPIKIGNQTKTYAKRFTASNISLIAKGAFNLTSMVINFTIGGSR